MSFYRDLLAVAVVLVALGAAAHTPGPIVAALAVLAVLAAVDVTTLTVRRAAQRHRERR